MSGEKKKTSVISWDEFVKLGNPDNAPSPIQEEPSEEISVHDVVRIHIEKKGRGGKSVSIIKGISGNEDQLKSLTKELKSSFGVGGTCKEGNIIIQGDKRKKIQQILIEKGYKNVKLAGG